MFQFVEFNDLKDDEIKLVLKSQDLPDYEKGILPRYGFSIIHINDNEDIGVIYFAVDNTRRQYLRGHLSYGVSPHYSGHNYAMKACKLIKQVALTHGFKRLFIGSGYDNIASRKTIEKLGATLITVNDVPDYEIMQNLQTEKIDMYVWDITV
ncbi:GNAT family N-acetyltransferase [Tissierella sp. MB52-C2]|uniref:GNAT family N-acetyltransferase n=1 Tax=Tissierella sp. MB52-C2 TaxID=3070999 RepID=UPI00280B9138|nr:GNAT family N-acetyltransferase [Tissierella sp. MB52-C2]WMM26781.1 GNAT family N-acetyltransferase [Tissierella sp. MB52-C2]